MTKHTRSGRAPSTGGEGGSANAILEGLNSVIQSVKRAARGLWNTGYFETMIFLRLGRLDFSAQLAVSSATH